MKPTGKTPYEIRLELLQLAQIILSQQHQAKAASTAQTNRAGIHYVDTAATSEEIITEAEKLNAFVSKANPTH
jgi:hypothetical protein